MWIKSLKFQFIITGTRIKLCLHWFIFID